MTKSIADLYNEVQNIANGNRRLDVAGQWEHAATPGNIPFDATNNEYMRNVEESQLKQQENRAEYIKNNYKKEVPVAAPVPGPAPIPVTKQPPLTRMKTVKEEQMTNKQQIDEVVPAAELQKSGMTLGQYLNKKRGLTPVKGGANDIASKGPKTNTPGTQGVATGKSFAEIDRNRKVVAQDKPSTPPAAPKALGGAKWSDQGAKERASSSATQSSTIAKSGGDAPVAAPKVAPLPPSRPTSAAPAPAAKMPGDDASSFVKKQMAKESTNSLIASFLALQEVQHSNMFEAAKKKKKPDDKNGVTTDVDSENEGGVPMAENTQIPGHRRVAMFDPSQGYARTAGSADGAKERLEALWGAVTGEQTVHRDAGLADAIRADLAAIKEEFGSKFDDEIEAITEALEEIIEAPKEKEHLLAALAAKAISKGHPVKKLPAGRAENSVLPKGMYGGGINHESGVKRQAKMRSEDVEQIEEGDLTVRTLYNKWAGHASGFNEKSPAKANAVEKAITKVHGPKVMGHLKKALNANLQGNFDRENSHFEKARTAAGKSEMIGSTVGRGRSEFRKTHEEVEFSAEELAHIQSVLEGNPVAGTASVEGSPSSEQAAKGLQVDKAVLTDSKKKV